MIEENLIGLLCVAPETVPIVFEKLKTDMFLGAKTKAAAEALYAALRDGRSYSPVTIADDIGVDYSVIQDWVGLSDINLLDEYIDRVRNNYVKVTFGANLAKAIKVLKDDGFEGAYELVDSSARELMQDIGDEEDEYLKAEKAVERAMSGEGFPSIHTGLPSYDLKYGGMYVSDLVVVAARPSMGKTALMLNIAYNAVRETSVVVFSLEMSKQQIIFRLATLHSGVPAWKIRTSKATKDEAARFTAAIKDISKWKLSIYGTEYGDINKMLAKIRIEKIKDPNLGLVLVDYIQLMSDSTTKQNRTQEVSNISRGLKLVAGEDQCNVTIVALSQLSRQVESRGDKRPMLSDLRDSGCLHGDSKVMTLGGTIGIRDMSGSSGSHVFSHNSVVKPFISKNCWKTKTAEVGLLKLSTGHKIKATFNHKFFTTDGWKPLSDIKVKDKVAIPLNFDDSNSVSEYSKDMAYFMGAMIANGKTHKRQPITYTCNTEDRALADELHRISESEFDCTARTVDNRPKYNWLNVYVKSNRQPTSKYRHPVFEFFDNQGIFDKRAHNKALPDSIYCQGKDLQLEMIAGLFDNDGSIHLINGSKRVMTNISYTSSSIDLINGLQLLLQMNGIVSRVKKLNKGKHVWYNLYISDRHSKIQFCEKVPLRSDRKKGEVEKIHTRLLSIRAGWSRTEYNENKSLAFVEVKCICHQEGEVPVYDIEVPVAHNFVANGILVHNSIEQDSNTVLMLYRPDYYLPESERKDVKVSQVELLVKKQREGSTGTIFLELNLPTGKFDDMKGAELIEDAPF